MKINRGAHIQANPVLEGLIETRFNVLSGKQKMLSQREVRPQVKALSTCRIEGLQSSTLVLDMRAPEHIALCIYTKRGSSGPIEETVCIQLLESATRSRLLITFIVHSSQYFLQIR